MKQRTLSTAVAALALLVAGGCAGNNSAVTSGASTSAATTALNADKSPAVPKKPQKITNAIAAIVNDDIITLNDVNKEARTALSDAEKKGALTDADRHKIRLAALDLLIEKKLTEQKIRELNIRVSDDDIRQAIDDVRKQNNFTTEEALAKALSAQGLTLDQYRSQLKEQLEKLKLVSMEVRAKVQVGEAEMREYYAANIAKYSEEETYRARHIFFKTGEKATPDEIKRSKTTALAVLADAKSGKDFAELAKKFSEDPAARKDGGDLGSFKKGDMQPELEKVILSLKPGEVSELVNTPIGFHIIKLEAKVAGVIKPFESVKAEIEETLYRKKSEERFNQWAAELRSKASIETKELDGLL
ncbi:MAG: peptidylprolyl isomerase [Desulfuromonadaceae bacterium]|nr:peptidylprolyl isomerase [Desulfuromonadaceae bacterium]MDD2847484.1 peptidylprolyl isomerase [Desulfuromonadaceae bacterium]MDD4131403.1 peptidylprolyl isomerase [Desulfuromonadaceae bacterium]